MTFYSVFKYGDRVLIDKDQALVATVTGFNFRHTGLSIAVSWMHNGEVKDASIEDFRLTWA